MGTQIERVKTQQIRKNHPLDKITTSFFFTNFSEEIQTVELWKFFARFGHVGEVFIPMKLDRWGRKFGFVKFKGVANAEVLERKMAGANLGNSKIKVNKARFDREDAKPVVPVEGAGPDVNAARVVEGKSYTQAVHYKAYDSVDWSFLEYMLRRVGFCSKWIAWMKACVFGSNMSILVNGTPTEEISIQRVLKQGDPLAPFLFLLVAEGFSGLMRSAVNFNLFRNNGLVVSYLQYADDTLCVGEACVENLWTLKALLRGFELVSGLKMNFSKSCLIGTLIGILWKWRVIL